MNEQFTNQLLLPIAKIKAAVDAIELELNRPGDDPMSYYRIGYFIGELSRASHTIAVEGITTSAELFNAMPNK